MSPSKLRIAAVGTKRGVAVSVAVWVCRRNGKPMTEQAVHKVFSTTSFRLTGKKCNPHLVRDSIVTYLRCAGAPKSSLA